MTEVTKGATGAKPKAKSKAPKLGEIIAAEQSAEKPVAFVSRKGADGAYVIAPGPIYGASGVQIGNDPGVHLDFRGVGVTGPYWPDSKPEDRKIVDRVKALIDEGWSIVTDLGLEVLEADAPRPPFSKWDRTSAPAIKVALTLILDEDDHSKNVALVKDAARYEKANLDRPDVMSVLDGLLATEAGQSDEYSVEVNLT